MKNMQSTRELIETFLIEKKSQNLSKTTILSYRSKLRLFSESVYYENDISSISPDQLRIFLHRYEMNHKPSTVYSVYRVLKLFFGWYEYELGEWDNPMRKVRPPRVPSKIIDPASLDTIDAMLPYCNIRNQSILLFLLDSGIRSAEFLSLTIDDVNLVSGAVYIKKGKGGKARTCFIGHRTRTLLRKYLHQRKDENPSLWVTSTGKSLSYSGLNALLKRIAARAGVKPPTPHDFRRAFTLNLLKDQIDLLTITQLLGHSGITNTLKLYAKLSVDDTMLAHHRSGVDKWLSR